MGNRHIAVKIRILTKSANNKNHEISKIDRCDYERVYRDGNIPSECSVEDVEPLALTIRGVRFRGKQRARVKTPAISERSCKKPEGIWP